MIEELKKKLADSIGALSIGNLILNIFLGLGMKYLWKMVNLLQFAVFMREREWQIIIPDKAHVWLKELKSLALFEFLPTEKLDAWVKENLHSDGGNSSECSQEDI